MPWLALPQLRAAWLLADMDVRLPPRTTVVLNGTLLNGRLRVRHLIVPASSTLLVADAPLRLEAMAISVYGRLQAGTVDCPLASPVVVELYGREAEHVQRG